MPNLQTGKNILVSFKPEVTMGVAAGATGGTQFRIDPSPGLHLKRAEIMSGEVRSDGMKTMGRLGAKSGDGSYNSDLSWGSHDLLLAAIMRANFTAALAHSQTDFTSITQGANSIVAASGSFLTKGYMVGDVIRINATGGPAANNNRNLRVTSVTASTLGIAETLVVDATPRTTLTITRGKKLSNPNPFVRQSLTVEEYNIDIDQSELFLGCRLVGMKLSGKPGSPVTVAWTFMTLDRQILTTTASPYFTAPSLATSLGVIADDSTIRYNGADIATFTGFDLDFVITAKAEQVVGSLVGPDIFDNDLTVSGTITALRSDLSYLTAYDAETEFETQIMLVENQSEPKNFLSLFLPRSKFKDVTKSLGGDGAMLITLPIMTGSKLPTVGYDTAVATFVTDAP